MRGEASNAQKAHIFQFEGGEGPPVTGIWLVFPHFFVGIFVQRVFETAGILG
jgi:hypothetical protein